MAFTVLIVDDDPVFRAIASELLSPWFTCIDVDGGGRALSYLASFPVDLIITDILMPDIDGLQLIRSARDDGFRVPIIAVSGGGVGQDAEPLLSTARDLGVQGVAQKPLQPDQFLRLVKQVLAEAANTALTETERAFPGSTARG